jgi:hypothetical protein
MFKPQVESRLKIIDTNSGHFILAEPSDLYEDCIEISYKLQDGSPTELGTKLILSLEQVNVLSENLLKTFKTTYTNHLNNTIAPEYSISSYLQETERIIALETKMIMLERELENKNKELDDLRYIQALLEDDNVKQIINERNWYKLDYEAEMLANQDLRVKFKAEPNETMWEMWDRLEKTLKDNNLL